MANQNRIIAFLLMPETIRQVTREYHHPQCMHLRVEELARMGTNCMVYPVNAEQGTRFVADMFGCVCICGAQVGEDPRPTKPEDFCPSCGVFNPAMWSDGEDCSLCGYETVEWKGGMRQYRE